MRQSRIVQQSKTKIETYLEGEGPAIVVLPSYGRDGGDDYDNFSQQVASVGFKVLRPQPRGIANSRGPMQAVTLHDLAEDIAAVIRELANGEAIVLGHAFGNFVARVIAVDHPSLVRGLILPASECSSVAPEISRTPHIACDSKASDEERLAALRLAFFAPNHDPSIWLKGWYPETMEMQVGAVNSQPVSQFWAAGSSPLLEIIPDHDPFKPHNCWGELHNQLGDRVTTRIIPDASHALFPEQPEKVAEVVIEWSQRVTLLRYNQTKGS